MEWFRIIFFFLLGVACGEWPSSIDKEKHAFKVDSEVKETAGSDEEGRGSNRNEPPDDSDNYEPYGTLPEEINWAAKGAVTSVKNEGPCKWSSWAFSATGALEGQYFKKTKTLVPLSEQHLIDCSGIATQNYGCNGGTHFNAYHYVMSRDNPRHGVATAKAYPFTGRRGKCRFNQTNTSIVGSMIFSVKVRRSEEHLKAAVATIGPIAAKMYAPPAFINYRNNNRIFYDDKCYEREKGGYDQYVLVVGYGVTKSKGRRIEYWRIKNSWGTGWGAHGFAFIARNRNNTCGIASDAIYPVLK